MDVRFSCMFVPSLLRRGQQVAGLESDGAQQLKGLRSSKREASGCGGDRVRGRWSCMAHERGARGR